MHAPTGIAAKAHAADAAARAKDEAKPTWARPVPKNSAWADGPHTRVGSEAAEIRKLKLVLWELRGKLSPTSSDVDMADDAAFKTDSSAARREQLREVVAVLSKTVAPDDRLLAEANAELATANGELDAYAFTVSHDLRAPLRSIDGYSALLLAELPPDVNPQAGDLIGRIRARVRHMGNLLEDLLHMSRFSRQELVRVDLDMRSLVSGIVEDAAQTAPAVVFEIDELPHCRADTGQLHQLWTNLISNAVKYSAKAATPRVHIGFQDGAYFVSDNGAGFDIAHADKLFRVFSRLHAEHEFTGTGIGLAIVKRVVQRHGGDIRAESAVGAGARFLFTIPD